MTGLIGEEKTQSSYKHLQVLNECMDLRVIAHILLSGLYE